MKRRNFIKSAGAIAALPLVPTPAISAPVATATPAAARFWGIYMAHLHGAVTPKMIATMTNVSPQLAKLYLKDLVAKGVIKSTAVDFGLSTVSRTGPKQNSIAKRFSKKLDEAMERIVKDDPAQIEESRED